MHVIRMVTAVFLHPKYNLFEIYCMFLHPKKTLVRMVTVVFLPLKDALI